MVEYQAVRVRQRLGAEPFYLLGAPASELLDWCDVPRAKGDYMAGYQRTLNERRTASLERYLDTSPSNIVPGAVIIALDGDYMEIEECDGDFCQIKVLPDARTFDEKLLELFGALSTRLSDEELHSASIAVSSADSSGDEDLGELVAPTSYLASLAAELQEALQDWNSLSPERQEAIRGFIHGVSKPGLIIDGQHRVFGAKDLNSEELRLPVVLLPGLTYSEQVFQFYILNSKAKPLKPTELRRIVSTSLSNEEITGLYERFAQSGIDTEEARWTYEMSSRQGSPFEGRIDFGYGNSGAVIKENVADQLVRAFMLMPAKRYRALMDPLGEQWSDASARLEIFFWFWGAIREEYQEAWNEAEEVADTGELPQLFMKVGLMNLQRFLLDRFVTALPYRGEGAAPPLESEEEVKSMVASTLKNLPQEFFQREWKLKQADTTEGHKVFQDCMEKVWNNQGKIHGNLLLFKG